LILATPQLIEVFGGVKMLTKQVPKIVAIDDDDLFLDWLVIWLEENGFQAIGAQNGWWGLQLVKEQMPDLVICDVSMPELDGYEVLRALRQDAELEKIPFIFLTCEQTDSARRRARELGADDYLDKFSVLEKLIKVVKVQLQVSQPAPQCR
jgi:DNA-binding response OmpR family regulator